MKLKDDWYKDGLNFSGTRCGNCCTGPPGYVWFGNDEANAIAAYLNISITAFRKRFAKRIHGQWSLKEIFNAGQHDCVFLTRDEQGKAGCSIYPVRPTQCRTWPFWPENLDDTSDWQEAARTCPGIGRGKLYPIEKIRLIRDNHDTP